MACSSGSWIRPSRRWAVYLRDGLACVFCAPALVRIVFDGGFFVLDHRESRRTTGSANENLLTACYDCNLHRSRRTLEDWLDKARIPVERWVLGETRRRAADMKSLRETAHVLLRARPMWLRANAWNARAQFRREDREPVREDPPVEMVETQLMDVAGWLAVGAS